MTNCFHGVTTITAPTYAARLLLIKCIVSTKKGLSTKIENLFSILTSGVNGNQDFKRKNTSFFFFSIHVLI